MEEDNILNPDEIIDEKVDDIKEKEIENIEIEKKSSKKKKKEKKIEKRNNDNDLASKLREEIKKYPSIDYPGCIEYAEFLIGIRKSKPNLTTDIDINLIEKVIKDVQ